MDLDFFNKKIIGFISDKITRNIAEEKIMTLRRSSRLRGETPTYVELTEFYKRKQSKPNLSKNFKKNQKRKMKTIMMRMINIQFQSC